MKNLIAEFSPTHDNRKPLSPVRKRRTLGNADDFYQRSFNNTNTNTNHKESIQSTQQKNFLINPDYIKIIEENDRLKHEVKRLQNIIMESQNGEKGLQRVGSSMLKKRETSQPDDMEKLKKIIEKSYYSIREMEKEIDQLRNQLSLAKKQCSKLTQKLQLSEIERDDIMQKLETIRSVHRQEIWVCNERIKSLEHHLEQLMTIAQADQRQWQEHRQKLSELRKFSFKRTTTYK